MGVVAALVSVGGVLMGQAQNAADGHVAAARAAAGQDHPSLFGTVCSPTAIRPAPRGAAAPAAAGVASPAAAEPQAARGRTSAAAAAPPREQWYAPPAKVFDNLYFVGQTEYSAWAVNTSEGIILIDTIFDYSVEAEVVEGLRKLGLDPARIRYAIVSHGHGDHSGGAKYLQDRFGTRIVMGEPDWDLVARTTRTPAPKRDIVAQDGQRLTLGDTTVTLYLTPGHTAGTISTLVPVRDNGRPHLAAAWGGTAFNFPRTPENFQTYINSADRFRDIVVKAGADVIIANHTNFDESKRKLPVLALRKPGEPHPYVVGTDAVRRYVTVAGECARAALAAMSER
jgi:metallo-beta-lactamase class B